MNAYPLTHDRWIAIPRPWAPGTADGALFYFPQPATSVFKRRSITVGLALIALIAGAVLTVFKAPASQADSLFDPLLHAFCGETEAFNYQAQRSGPLAALGIGQPWIESSGYADGKTASSFRHTASELFGSSTPAWTVYRGFTGNPSGEGRISTDDAAAANGGSDPRKDAYECAPVLTQGSTAMANFTFSLAGIVTTTTTWLYTKALDASFLDALSDGAVTLVSGKGSVTGLKDALYLPWLVVIAFSSSIYLLFLGFRRKFSQVWSNLIWLAGASIVGSVLIFNPALLPGISNEVLTLFTTSLSNATTGIVTGKGAAADSICTVPAQGLSAPSGATKVSSATQRNIRSTECSMWAVFVYAPWVSGQFGDSVADAAKTQVSSGLDTKVSFGGGAKTTGDLALAQLWNQTLTPLDTGTTRPEAKAAAWFGLADEVMVNQPQMVSAWSGKDTINRLSISTLALIAALAGCAVIVVLAGSILAFKVGAILLVAVSPVFLLLGAHAGFGRGIALKWLSMLAGFYLKSAVASALIAVVMLFYAVITQQQAAGALNYGVALLVLVLVSFTTLAYRQQVMTALGDLHLPGQAHDGGLESGSRTVKRVGAAGIGVAAGAAGATGHALGAAKAAGSAANAAGAAGGATRAQRSISAFKAAGSAGGKAAAKGAVAGGKRGYRHGEVSAKGATASGRSGHHAAGAHRRQEARDTWGQQREQRQQENQAAEAQRNRRREDNTAFALEALGNDDARMRAREAGRARVRTADYRRWWAEHGHEDPATSWHHERFRNLYGFEAPDADYFDFPGYGLNILTGPGAALRNHYAPRPRQEEEA